MDRVFPIRIPKRLEKETPLMENLINPNAQLNKLKTIRWELATLLLAMDDYSAFDEISEKIKEAKRILIIAESRMKKKIKDNVKG